MKVNTQMISKQDVNNKVVIAFATDSNYIYYTGVTVFTMLQHISAEHEYHIVIMSSDLTDDELENFEAIIKTYPNVSFEYLDMSKWIAQIGAENFYTGNYSIANYYRLFLCDVLKNEDKIIYLDSDIIVQDDIFKLWATDMQNYAIAAALDKNAAGIAITPDEVNLKRLCARLNIKKPKNYFNSGVMIMNLKKLRDMNFLNIVRKEVMTGLKFELVDQDILNRVFENNYLKIDKTWNHQPVKADEAYQNDHILHISGLRPWESVYKPYADIWWSWAEKTPFYEKLKVKANEARSRYLEKLEFKYFEIFDTTCWKITKPLRILFALMQNFR